MNECLVCTKKKNILIHSAKGSSWKDHKYIKRIDGTYYYPDSYEGGRQLPKGENGRTQYGEYDENDPDFSDASWEKAKRLGDTDFHAFQRDDGTWVILEEDMKWVLPKGVDPNSPEFVKSLEGFSNKVSQARKNGEKFTHEDWNKAAKEAIDGAIGSKTSGSSGGKLSDKDVENLANEIIRGNFGNGDVRKELLGEHYQQVQSRVNELMNGSLGSTPVESVRTSATSGSDTSSNRPRSRQRKVVSGGTGVYRRGNGLNSSSPVGSTRRINKER